MSLKMASNMAAIYLAPDRAYSTSFNYWYCISNENGVQYSDYLFTF